MQEIILTIFSSSSRQLHLLSHPPWGSSFYTSSVLPQQTRYKKATFVIYFVYGMPVCVCVCMCVRILLYREFFGLPAVLFIWCWSNSRSATASESLCLLV